MDAALGLDTSLVTCQYSANIIHLIHPNFTLGSAMITLCKNPAKPALKFLSHVALRTTMHSGATPLLRGFSRKNIFCQKIFDNFFSFQATEMVLTSKWGRIQQEIQI